MKLTRFVCCVLFIATVVHSSMINPTGKNYTICSYNTSIVDPTRPSIHKIPLLIYYPCNRANKYPFMVFGHASASSDEWYDYIWKGMVPQGYICVFLGTFDADAPKEFAKDQRYTNDWVRDTCSNDPNCALYKIVQNKSIVSGTSMGGGAAMISAGNHSLNESFNHSFDALMTLSGCNSRNSSHASMTQNSLPSLIMSGNHDCVCPVWRDADTYYKDMPQSTCKYLAIITNATHCHFEGYIGAVADDLCKMDESEQCAKKGNISYTDNIAEVDQHQIVIKYYSLFMYATLYENNGKQALTNVSNELIDDKANGVMYNISVGC